MTIVSPAYSLIYFGARSLEACCDGNDIFCLPVVSENDLAFQVNLACDTAQEAQDLFDKPDDAFQLVLIKDGISVRNFTTQDLLTFDRFRTSLKTVTLVWLNPLQDFVNYIDCDECFQLGLQLDAGGESYTVEHSNFLKRKCDSCYTSVFEYYNDEDYGGFNYCNTENVANRARLPLSFSQPQMKEDKAVYRRSDGTFKQTRSLLTKEYSCTTEYMPGWIHDAIVVALAHDNVNIQSDGYNGGISKSSDYAIEWIDNYCAAPASFKALATPYFIKNDNCAECKDVEDDWDGSYSLTFTVGSITATSFIISTGFSSGVTWDLSLDGGATFVQTGLTSSTYTVTGLTTGITYQVVRRMHGIYGSNQTILPSTPVTTL